MNSHYLRSVAKVLEESAAALRKFADVQANFEASLPGSIPVVDLVASMRARKAFARLGVKTLADMTSKTAAEILLLPSTGATTVREIRQVMAKHGLKLCGE